MNVCDTDRDGQVHRCMHSCMHTDMQVLGAVLISLLKMTPDPEEDAASTPGGRAWPPRQVERHRRYPVCMHGQLWCRPIHPVVYTPLPCSQRE